MSSFAGIVLRSPDRQRIADFYRKIGFSTKEHKHGGPVHFEVGPSSPDVVLEIYQGTTNYSGDALMVSVEDLDRVLAVIGVSDTDVKSTSEGRLAYVTDPDGRTVLLLEIVGSI